MYEFTTPSTMAGAAVVQHEPSEWLRNSARSTLSALLPPNRPDVPAARLLTGIPVLDRFMTGAFGPGQVTLLDGPAEFLLYLSCRFAVNGVSIFRRPVLFVDGGNTADPYGFVTVCRRMHLDPKFVLDRIFIARAFTVYQLDTLFAQLVEERLRALEPAVLIVSAMSSMYLDSDVNWDEAKTIFQNDLVNIRELTERYGVMTLITILGAHKSYHSQELSRMLRASAVTRIEMRSRYRHRLQLVRNGTEVIEFTPLPAHQCSLDDFLPGGPSDG